MDDFLTLEQLGTIYSQLDGNGEWAIDDSESEIEYDCGPAVLGHEQDSDSGESDEESLKSIENAIKFSSQHRFMKSANGYKWSVKPSARDRYNRHKDHILHFSTGPRRGARDKSTPLECFILFMRSQLVNSIVLHTNEEIKQHTYNGIPPLADKTMTSLDEMNALIGLLVMIGRQKNNTISSDELFCPVLNGTIYPSVMSHKRFKFLLKRMRFSARPDDSANDPFSPIRDCWNKLMFTCRTFYNPGTFLAIGDHFINFESVCDKHSDNQENKNDHNIKAMMICDVKTGYLVNAKLYNSKITDLTFDERFDMVKGLTKTIHGSKRVVSFQNNLTSPRMARKLLKKPYRLQIVGAIPKCTDEVPKDLFDRLYAEIGTTWFCYDGPLTLLSQKIGTTKNAVYLSSSHGNGKMIECNETNRHVPDIVDFHKYAGEGMKKFTKARDAMSCSRRTQKWTLNVFYEMINIALVNSYIVHIFNSASNGAAFISREIFMDYVAKSLMEPWLQRRKNDRNLSIRIKGNVHDALILIEDT